MTEKYNLTSRCPVVEHGAGNPRAVAPGDLSVAASPLAGRSPRVAVASQREDGSWR